MVAVLLMGVMHQLRCMAKGENLTAVHVLWWNHKQIFKNHIFFFKKGVELAIEFFFWFLYPNFIFNSKLNLEKKVKMLILSICCKYASKWWNILFRCLFCRWDMSSFIGCYWGQWQALLYHSNCHAFEFHISVSVFSLI